MRVWVIKVCICYDACIIAESDVTVVVKLTLPNGEVFEIGRPPKYLKSIKEIKTGSESTAVCHYKGYTYVGQTSGAIDRIDVRRNGHITQANFKLPNMIMSFAIHNERVYVLLYADKNSSNIRVYELNDSTELTSWQHPHVPYFGQRMFVTDDTKLVVGDWPSKQIIIHSLTGDVIRMVPCPPSLTMNHAVCMSSCGDDSVVISDYKAGIEVRMSLRDGSLLWSSDRVTNPSGIVHHPAGYVLVVSTWTDQTEISVLDETNGRSSFLIDVYQPWAKCGLFAAAALKPIVCSLLVAFCLKKFAISTVWNILAIC